MIPARKHPLIERWFTGYTRNYLRRSFHRVLLAGELPQRPAGPVIVCVSHSSWWDMLMAFWLSQDVLGWDGYGPMDERQLRRYHILTRIGVFGVDRETMAGGRDFLAYAGDLLKGKNRSLWVTAQGEMASQDTRPVRFYSGVAHLAKSLGEVTVVTAAFQYEFWDEKRPEAFVSFGPICQLSGASSRHELLRQLEADLEQRMDALAMLRQARNASAFTNLLVGGSSVSPVYDALRSITARLRGEKLQRDHGAVATPPRWGPAARRETGR